MRRFASKSVVTAAQISASAASALAGARRFYTPPADLVKLYQGEFDRGAFPADIVPSDATLFAKFLYRAAEAGNSFDAITKDFKSIEAASKKLPVFWQRSVDLDAVAEFKALSPATLFTLNWMQGNGMLDLIPNVEEAYATFVNAKQKKVVAKVYVNPAQLSDAGLLAKAKEVAAKLQAQNESIKGFTLVVNAIADSDIKSGFTVDLVGAYQNEAQGEQSAKGDAAREIDYTQVPQAKATKTKWDDSAEVEVLNKYFESLAKYDLEEAKNGV